MKPIFATLALSTALTMPAIATARPVTLTTTLNGYGGDGAYLAVYVKDLLENLSARSGWPARKRNTTRI